MSTNGGHERTAPTNEPSSPPLIGAPPADGAAVGSVALSILGGDGGGRHAPVNVGGWAAAVLLAGVDPLDGVGSEVGAGNVGVGFAHDGGG